MQAADLIGRIAVVMKACGEDQLMGHLGVVLYEYLGEEYPEVLGSILGALRAIVNVIGMTKMTPPIRDLLPRLTPILRNRHEKVQENCIDLVSQLCSCFVVAIVLLKRLFGWIRCDNFEIRRLIFVYSWPFCSFIFALSRPQNAHESVLRGLHYQMVIYF
jgi:hypothetical protein